MRESSPNNFSTTHSRTAPQSECKSLFRKILTVSLSGSRFCPDSGVSPPSKLLRMSILGNGKKKILRDRSSQNRSLSRQPTAKPRTGKWPPWASSGIWS